MTPWTYDLTIFVMGGGALAVALWFVRKRQKASQKGEGVRVLDMGVFGAAIGCVLELSSIIQDLGTVRWKVMALAFLAGAALGALAGARWVPRWELATGGGEDLRPRIERWSQAWWFLLLFMAFWFVIAVLFSQPIGSYFDKLGVLVSAASNGLPGFFVGFGLLIAFWAKRKEGKGFKPLVFPHQREKQL